LRSLEIGRSGLGGDGKPLAHRTTVYQDRDVLPHEVISQKLSVPNAERIFSYDTRCAPDSVWRNIPAFQNRPLVPGPNQGDRDFEEELAKAER